MNSKNIFIIRHGKPLFWEHHSPYEWVNYTSFDSLIKEYDSSGIIKVIPQNRELTLARQSTVFLSSNLPRAIESAKMLSTSNVLVNDCFREAELPSFKSLKTKLPLFFWIVLIRLKWAIGLNSKTENLLEFKKRLHFGANYLNNLSKTYNCITLVAHGLSNRYLIKNLTSLSWKIENKLDYNYWGTNHLIK